MSQNEKFTLLLDPSIIIVFEQEFVIKNWHSSILSIANNKKLWKDNFMKNKFHIVRGALTYNNNDIKIQGVSIDPSALHDPMIYYVAERIAKNHNTIAYYKYGDYISFYDFKHSLIK